ncbi:MAG: glycosyltransferase [Bacillota bacterium]
MTGGQTVSLCIIARNEERCIEACINSARDLADEIILVDTGSTDKTREIAAGCGAGVYTYTWRDDFAAARNYSLELARGDWILVLDADEILEPVGPGELAGLMSAQAEGYFITIRNYLDKELHFYEDSAVRLFKNNPRYRFENPLHEQVATSIKRHNSGAGLVFSSLLIHHFGYLQRRIESKQKRSRNIDLIKKALTGKKGDPFLLYSLGIEYFQAGQTLKGIECVKNALTGMRGDEGYFRDALVALGTALLESGRTEDLSTFLDGALYMLPEEGDLRLLKGILLLRERRYPEALEDLRRGLAGNSRILPPEQVHSLIGDALAALNRPEEARREYFNALAIKPGMPHPLKQLPGLYSGGAVPGEWLDLINDAPFTVKKELYRELAQKEKYLPSLAVSLLCVIEAVKGEDTATPAELCADCLCIIKKACPEKNPLLHHLDLLAGEMYVCAGLLRLGCPAGLFSPAPRIAQLASDILKLLSHMGTPPDQPPSRNNKEV